MATAISDTLDGYVDLGTCPRDVMLIWVHAQKRLAHNSESCLEGLKDADETARFTRTFSIAVIDVRKRACNKHVLVVTELVVSGTWYVLHCITWCVQHAVLITHVYRTKLWCVHEVRFCYSDDCTGSNLGTQSWLNPGSNLGTRKSSMLVLNTHGYLHVHNEAVSWRLGSRCLDSELCTEPVSVLSRRPPNLCNFYSKY